MIVFWLAVALLTVATVVAFAVGMAAHVRDQQIPREVTAREAQRIAREMGWTK
jgi:hypothetical protein